MAFPLLCHFRFLQSYTSSFNFTYVYPDLRRKNEAHKLLNSLISNKMRFVLNFAEMRRRYFLNWGKSEARILKKKAVLKKKRVKKKSVHTLTCLKK